MNMSYLFYFSFSCFLSWILVGLLLPKLKKYLLYNPNERSSHQISVPSGGGIVFVLVSSILCYLQGNSICIICLPIAAIGLIDDIYKLSPLIRYIAQLIVSFIIINFQPLTKFTLLNIPIFLSIILVFSLLLLITAVINFTNFMDGIDGLVGGSMFVVITSAAVVNNPSLWPLAGSILGFLIWNWSPAKVFMGDVGSTFLGIVFTGILLQSNSWTEAIGLFLIATPIMLDAAICVIRRMINCQNIFLPHKLHLYQRLHQAGWNHSKVSFVYILSAVLLSFTFMSYGITPEIFCIVLLLLIGYFLDKKYAISFSSSLLKYR